MQILKVKLFLGISILLTATKSSAAEACNVCPAFWVPFQGSCYRVFGKKLSWSAAEESCKQLFNKKVVGHLVSIRNADENRFVSQLWDSSTGGSTDSSNRAYWIGLSDRAKEGSFVWTDNKKEGSYTNWKRSEPNNHGNEDCAHVLKDSDGKILLWNDTECHRTLSYVCELPQ
ncbi:alpha-N-acetylgalactosamine-specific lectin-like [Anneissia japonica]|uniref:alpha-N-acetylgalactosamine-specific lectin-like n=1 Tax=Anneissia japonica TaxID=1529436 RepID=UPI001425517D|nr:alpha-N-acetylgalactosamine-specific lectin-like [Anneissia japonica]